MKSQERKKDFINEIETAIRARIPVIWIETSEETRTVKKLVSLAKKLSLIPWTWTATEGSRNLTNNQLYPNEIAISKAMNADRLAEVERRMYIMKDAAVFVQNDAFSRRAIRDEMINGKTREAAAQKVFIFIDQEPPPDSLPGIYRATLPLPDVEELAALVAVAVEATYPEPPENTAARLNETEALAAWKADTMEKATKKYKTAVAKIRKNYNEDRQGKITAALVGLTSDAARDALLKSRATCGEYQAGIIAQEKKQLINSEALEWIDPDPRGADAIGGYPILKEALFKYRESMSPQAAAFGVPPVKGVLTLGLPGTGKSLAAKAAGNIFELPCIRLNVGAIMGPFVGNSEQNWRNCAATIRAAAPCILFIDEVEKALGGASGPGGDSGTTSRVFAEILTFMSDSGEDGKQVFIFATSNSLELLPPEFKRKGRFDNIFFLDVPNEAERREIFQVMAKKWPRAAEAIAADLDSLASKSKGYTGAEIEAGISEAIRNAYQAKTEQATTADIVANLTKTPPLAQAEAPALESMKQWAKVNATAASPPDLDTQANEMDNFKID